KQAPRTQRNQFDASINSGAWNADKICLANYYSFVIMRGNYDKNVALFWNQPPMVRPVNCICLFDISCGYSLRGCAGGNASRRAVNSNYRGRSAECLRRACGPVAQPCVQHSATACIAS